MHCTDPEAIIITSNLPILGRRMQRLPHVHAMASDVLTVTGLGCSCRSSINCTCTSPCRQSSQHSQECCHASTYHAERNSHVLLAASPGLKAYEEQWLQALDVFGRPYIDQDSQSCKDLHKQCPEWAALVRLFSMIAYGSICSACIPSQVPRTCAQIMSACKACSRLHGFNAQHARALKSTRHFQSEGCLCPCNCMLTER